MAIETIKNQNGWSVRTLSGSSADLNALIGFEYAGFFSIQRDVLNAPANWCLLINIPTSVDSVRQIALEVGSTYSKVYVRAYMGTPRVWSAWKIFETTL